MSKGINRVTLIGRLGALPEKHITQTGVDLTTVSVATHERWRDRSSGRLTQRTEWHRVVLFAGLAEIACQYLQKGSQVYIEGSLRTRKWTDQTGQERWSTEVVAQELLMLDSIPGRSENEVTEADQQLDQKDDSIPF